MIRLSQLPLSPEPTYEDNHAKFGVVLILI